MVGEVTNCNQETMKKCRYGAKLDTTGRYFCDYLCINLRLRECMPSECTKFKPRKGVKKVEA